MSDQPRPPRDLIVVDVETNGLSPQAHQVVEVAWWNLSTDQRGTFVPQHNISAVLAAAEIKALQVNRYVDRIADAPQDLGHAQQIRLWTALKGATLAGANPAFDAAMLAKLFAGCDTTAPNTTPWHYRLFDVSAYAAGVLGLDDIPGLYTVCQLLGVEPGDHSAERDVTATGTCIRILRDCARAATTTERSAA